MSAEFIDIETQCALWIIEEQNGLTDELIAERDRWLAADPAARAIYDALRRSEARVSRAFPRPKRVTN